MRLIQIYTPIIVVLLCSNALVAQQGDVNFTALTTRDGLSSNTVNAILKDQLGLMWFGTDDGLVKFDGINFTTYRQKPGDSTSLPANEILALHEDRAGRLWVGTSGGSLARYDRRKDIFVQYPARSGVNVIDNNVIRSIWSDHNGKMWIAHYSGVNILDPETNRISRLPLAFGTPATSSRSCVCIYEDSRHNIWVGTNEGLFKYSPDTKGMTYYAHSDNNLASLSGNLVNAVVEDVKGNIWVGTDQGLSLMRPHATGFSTYRQSNDARRSLSSNFINSIAIDGDSLWLGTGEGLDILRISTGDVSRLHTNFRDNHSLTGKSVRTVFIDPDRIYWIGTIRGGVDKYDRNLNLFNYIDGNVFDDKGLHASIFTSFAEAPDGNVFIGTEGRGVSLFNRRSKMFEHLELRSRLHNTQKLLVLSLKMNRNNQLLVGTFSDGLFVLNPVSRTQKQFLKGPGVSDLNANDIFCIEEDHNGDTWVGTNGEGINVLDANFNVITRYTPNPKSMRDVMLPINGYIRDIREDINGDIWIATHGGGIALLNRSSGKFTIYNSSNSGLANDKVQSLLEDAAGNIWAGTFGGGVSVFDRETKKFTVFSEKNGLQNSTIYKVLQSSDGLVWVSTNKGISSISLATKKVNNYNHHNGVQNNNFVPGSGVRLSNNEMFFGGVEGFNYFNPSTLRVNTNVPEILVTELRVSNKTITPSEDGPLTEQISIAKDIHLDYKQNFAFSFVALNYTSPGQNQYAYKMEGLDKEWNYAGSTNTAQFTNLDPGKYIFRVKASNNDGVWNNEGASLIVHIHPPFWRTVYAYILYGILAIGVLLYIRYRGIQRLEKKFALQQERIQIEQERKENERTHELDRLKIKFLTNLSHEFRTPISLILGPVDRLIAREGVQHPGDDLGLIKRNARRLLNLVNQLLDFRKMEEQELKLQKSEGELISFIKEVADAFQDLAQRKKTTFLFDSKVTSLATTFDHDKIERILFNVLSNAFKFTLAGGQVSLIVTQADQKDEVQTWININITDNGIGIPKEDKDKIFERFFQHTTAASVLNQGTGIGLSITREFVEMQGGRISVESEVGRGTTFNICLPFVPVAQKEPLAVPDSFIDESEDSPENLAVLSENLNNNNLPLVLLVEDNDDFRFYLKENLRLQYRIIEAVNGKEGWQRALANHPQLIVSDISMPYMDGVALTRKLKADKRTNHIPVILLTAIGGKEYEIKGLESGANDYITKPFNAEVLNAKIRNLLDLNLKLKTTYTKQLKVIAPEVKMESADEMLLQKIANYIDDNLTDMQLSVENLSRHVGMSRSSLYSKVLEITGQTPVEYIRSVKLDKAAVLLKSSDMNVAQIAYSVGFSTPNYFAKSFKAKFNMLPSEFISKVRNTQKKEAES